MCVFLVGSIILFGSREGSQVFGITLCGTTDFDWTKGLTNRQGKERKGKERKGKERKGKERKGK